MIKTGDLRQNQAVELMGSDGEMAPYVYVANWPDGLGGGSGGGLTDTQLRAAPVPVSAVALPLPAGAATAAKQDTAAGLLNSIETLLAGNINVVGGFYPATQPISGSVSISGSVPVTGTFWQGTQPVSLASLPALVAGSAVIGKVGTDLTTPGTTNGVSLSHIGAVATATGNGVAGTGVQRVTVASDNSPLAVTLPTPTTVSINSAATTNLSTVKAGSGKLYGLVASNNGAAAAFLKLYNKATNPTLASDVPFIIIPIPAGSSVSPNLGPIGLLFSVGIAVAITNLVADTDATAIAASQVKVMLSLV